MTSPDTIAAISSGVAPSTRMIVRTSGPLSPSIVKELTSGNRFVANAILQTPLTFDGLRFEAIVYCFVSPHSATGEDAAEFHIPGNPLLAKMLLKEMLRLGARQAESGEFTSRGYFNGKLTLAAAEGVAASIAAH